MGIIISNRIINLIWINSSNDYLIFVIQNFVTKNYPIWFYISNIISRNGFSYFTDFAIYFSKFSNPYY